MLSVPLGVRALGVLGIDLPHNNTHCALLPLLCGLLLLMDKLVCLRATFVNAKLRDNQMNELNWRLPSWHHRQRYCCRDWEPSAFAYWPSLLSAKLSCARLLNHRLRGSASPVLTATGFVNRKKQFSTPHRIDTPHLMIKNFVTGDYVGNPYSYAKLSARGASGHMGEI